MAVHYRTIPSEPELAARRRTIVALLPRTRAAWWPLRDVAYAEPGTVIVGLDGTTLRIREDGTADVVGD
jgi:hypothetical protein